MLATDLQLGIGAFVFLIAGDSDLEGGFPMVEGRFRTCHLEQKPILC